MLTETGKERKELKNHIHPLRQVRSSFSMNKIGMLRLTKHKTNN